jgi:hypothetical protein
MTPRHEAALAYARSGIPIFPCGVNSKKPAIVGGKGFQDATCDIDQINAWWQVADYNIGLEPGRMNWFVIDIDPRHRGDESFEQWCKTNSLADLPTIRTVLTPSGGRHLYFAGVLPPTKAGVLGEGLDIRSSGGYVLVPPSIIDGVLYRVSP